MPSPAAAPRHLCSYIARKRVRGIRADKAKAEAEAKAAREAAEREAAIEARIQREVERRLREQAAIEVIKREANNEAAVKLQAAGRGYLGRRRVRGMREEQAAMAMQRVARGSAARRDVRQRREAKAAEEQRQGAAVCIQRHARGRMARQRVKHLQENAAYQRQVRRPAAVRVGALVCSHVLVCACACVHACRFVPRRGSLRACTVTVVRRLTHGDVKRVCGSGRHSKPLLSPFNPRSAAGRLASASRACGSTRPRARRRR